MSPSLPAGALATGRAGGGVSVMGAVVLCALDEPEEQAAAGSASRHRPIAAGSDKRKMIPPVRVLTFIPLRLLSSDTVAVARTSKASISL